VNERIEKLWYQAGGHYNGGNQHTWPKYTIDNPEKFVELIVQDLIHSMIKRYGDDDELPIQEIKLFVKEHFELEEQVTESNEWHTCPYAEEIHHDYDTLCDCDEEQAYQCRMDI
jgi:hypothetical protein